MVETLTPVFPPQPFHSKNYAVVRDGVNLLLTLVHALFPGNGLLNK